MLLMLTVNLNTESRLVGSLADDVDEDFAEYPERTGLLLKCAGQHRPGFFRTAKVLDRAGL